MVVLDRKWYDQCPVLVHFNLIHCNPSSFKFYKSWLKTKGFNKVVSVVVNEFIVKAGWSNFVMFKNKLKFIKNHIHG